MEFDVEEKEAVSLTKSIQEPEFLFSTEVRDALFAALKASWSAWGTYGFLLRRAKLLRTLNRS